MVFGWGRGPKAILASTIASALAEYFVVDEKKIEANLIKDTKIVLYNVQLREQRNRLHDPDANGRAAVVTVSGVVEEVAFTWTWSVGSNASKADPTAPVSEATTKEGWVKNALLTIKGLKFEAEFEYCTDNVETTSLSSTVDQDEKEDELIPPTPSSSTEVSTKAGGLQGYIQEQVKLILDSLTLNVTDFELTVKLPPEEQVDGPSNKSFAILIGGKAVQLLSFGRKRAGTTVETKSHENQQPVDEGDTTVLEQRLSIGSFHSSVSAQTVEETVTHPLLEPFSYSATVTRLAGDRFSSGFGHGLEVVGQPVATAAEARANGLDDGIVLHAGTVQLVSLSQLTKMVLPPTADKEELVVHTAPSLPTELTLPLSSDPLVLSAIAEAAGPDSKPSVSNARAARDNIVAENDGPATVEEISELPPSNGTVVQNNGLATVSNDNLNASVKNATEVIESSLFKLVFFSVSLVVAEATKITVQGVTMNYRADGTVCAMEAQGLKVEDQSIDTDDISISVSGMRASLEPTLVMQLDAVETARVSGVFQLTKSMYDTTIKFEGNTFCVHMASVETMLIRKTPAVGSSAIEAVDQSKSVGNGNKKFGSKISGETSVGKGSKLTETQETRPLDADSSEKEMEQVDMSVTGDEKAISGNVPDEAVNEIRTSLSASALQSDDTVSHGELVGDSISTKGELTSNRLQVQDNDKAPSKATFSVPFPISVSVQELVLSKSNDKGRPNRFTGLSIDIIPGSEGTFLGCSLDEFKNELLVIRNAASSAVVDLGHPEEIQNFKFAAEGGEVSAGYSTGDWSNKFDAEEVNASDMKHESKVTKLPFAEVSALKIRITLKGGVVSSKDTALTIKPFVGKVDTTSQDMLNYYIRAVLSRAPHFITNADVLGQNVIDSAAVSYGTWLTAATPVGAAGGLAGIAAVDAIKGAIAVGKRQRNAASDDQWEYGDFTRGLLHLTDAISHSGATKRGKGDNDGQDIADFAVGVVAGTGEYVTENKARLGAAGAGGAGFLVGTILGGPLGGIAGAVIASAVAGKTIEGVEEHLAKQPKPIENEHLLAIQEGDTENVSTHLETSSSSSNADNSPTSS